MLPPAIPGKQMRQLRIGGITIDAVIEREGPWRRPQDFFPAYEEAAFKRHLPAMEPEVFDRTLGIWSSPTRLLSSARRITPS
jgi:hypothetical protein